MSPTMPISLDPVGDYLEQHLVGDPPDAKAEVRTILERFLTENRATPLQKMGGAEVTDYLDRRRKAGAGSGDCERERRTIVAFLEAIKSSSQARLQPIQRPSAAQAPPPSFSSAPAPARPAQPYRHEPQGVGKLIRLLWTAFVVAALVAVAWQAKNVLENRAQRAADATEAADS